MRILHISSHKTWRGGEQQMTYLLHELRKLGCFQWFFCSEGNAMHLYTNKMDLPSYSFKNGFLANFVNKGQLKEICYKHKIDLIHVHDSHSHTLAFISGLFGNKTPIIVSRRVDFPIRKSVFSKWKYNYSGIERIICISHKIKEIVAVDIKDKAKLVVVHSGIDLKRFEGKTNKGILRKEYNIEKEEWLIGNVSAIAPHKDYFTLVDTAEIVLNNGIKARFLLIGDGPMKEQIKEYINNKGLSDKIIMTGFRTDIPDVLPELDVFLFSSETEGLGTGVLDAIACKVPIVATRAGGVPEMIEHEKNGLLADIKDSKTLADNVIRILNNETFRKNIVQEAEKTLMNFTKESMAKKTFNVYEKVLAEIEKRELEKQKPAEVVIPY